METFTFTSATTITSYVECEDLSNLRVGTLFDAFFKSYLSRTPEIKQESFFQYEIFTHIKDYFENNRRKNNFVPLHEVWTEVSDYLKYQGVNKMKFKNVDRRFWDLMKLQVLK